MGRASSTSSSSIDSATTGSRTPRTATRPSDSWRAATRIAPSSFGLLVVADVFDRARRGLTMPPKATYFYPEAPLGAPPPPVDPWSARPRLARVLPRLRPRPRGRPPRDLPTRAEREPVLRAGEGGDDTTAIDAAAELAVVERLEGLGLDLTLVSEELGLRAFGAGGGLRVVVDPIDGSVNAKRGIPFFSLSLAVAEGETMDDVFFGFVHDFGAGEEWVAERGRGAFLDGAPIDGPGPRRRSRSSPSRARRPRPSPAPFPRSTASRTACA